jgi:mannose-6-phosphate isomerase-like protein (cupin superfamily)
VNLKVYIKSGILELFVLDLLDEAERAEVRDTVLQYPILEKEIKNIESTLQLYATSIAIEPPKSLKAKIETSIANVVKEKHMDMQDLPLIDSHSDYQNWINFVLKYFPTAFESDNFSEVLRNENGVTQVLVVSSIDIDDETHDDTYESFLILQGQCKCTVGDESFYLNPGGYTQIPLREHHKVEITSPSPVMAIAQYVSVAG